MYKFLLIALISLILPVKIAFSQEIENTSLKNKNPDSSENLSTESIKNIVKEAIRESDQEKDRKHAQLLADIKAKLNAKAQEWIVSTKHSRETELNKLQHTAWELGGLVNHPVPYDYYLRGFDYLTTKTDVKTDSLFTPYKANINIAEKLYVEGIHSSEAADIRQYYYTLTRIIALSLEYDQNSFLITGTEYGPFQLEPGWRKN